MERSNAVCRGSDGWALPKEMREKMLSASPQPGVFNYQWQIRQIFDPNDLGDTYYKTLEPKK